MVNQIKSNDNVCFVHNAILVAIIHFSQFNPTFDCKSATAFVNDSRYGPPTLTLHNCSPTREYHFCFVLFD